MAGTLTVRTAESALLDPADGRWPPGRAALLAAVLSLGLWTALGWTVACLVG